MRRYAAYKGDKCLGIGTIEEVAKIYGIKPGSVYKLSSPSHIKNAGPKAKKVFKVHAGLNEYAAYKGDEILAVGTIAELAEFLEIKEKTVRFLATPSYLRRIKNFKNRLQVVKLEDDELEEKLG